MEHWLQLEKTCRSCQKCALADTRTNVVFGDGNPNAEILFIGEAPGEQEDLSGLPFVGKSGKYLTDRLDYINLDRSNYYIANIVKCRPPNNRDPLNIETVSCIGFLEEQIRLMQPKIIVCVGRVAAEQIINPKFKITQAHGQWFDYHGIHAIAFYHPASIHYGKNRDAEFFEDVKTLERKITEICTQTYS